MRIQYGAAVIMMQKRDSGLSMAVGFVMVLLVIAMIIGMWAVVGVPEQIRDAEDYHAIEVTNSFLDYKIAVDNQRVHAMTGLNISMLIPAASGYSDGALFMDEGVGTLRVLLGSTENTYDISRLYTTFGTTNTRVGYEGGGVFRNDYGSAVWVTPPSINIDKDGSDLDITMIIPEMHGAFAVGSSEGIPVETGLVSSIPTYVNAPQDQMLTITYTAEEQWDAVLWSTFFNETQILYQSEGVSITSTMPLPITATLQITPPPGGVIYLTIIKPVYDVDVRRF